MPPKPRSRKLTTDSLRTTEWQEEEYARLMGHEKAAEQIRASRLGRGLCVCKRKTVKSHGVFRTIHERSCKSWRPYMEEYENLDRRGYPTSD